MPDTSVPPLRALLTDIAGTGPARDAAPARVVPAIPPAHSPVASGVAAPVQAVDPEAPVVDPDPPQPLPLNRRQLRFCTAVASGMPPAEAARWVGYSPRSIHSQVYRMMRNDEIRNGIAVVEERMQAARVALAHDLIARLRRLGRDAEAAGRHATVLKCIDFEVRTLDRLIGPVNAMDQLMTAEMFDEAMDALARDGDAEASVAGPTDADGEPAPAEGARAGGRIG